MKIEDVRMLWCRRAINSEDAIDTEMGTKPEDCGAHGSHHHWLDDDKCAIDNKPCDAVVCSLVEVKEVKGEGE